MQLDVFLVLVCLISCMSAASSLNIFLLQSFLFAPPRARNLANSLVNVNKATAQAGKDAKEFFEEGLFEKELGDSVSACNIR